MWNITDTQNRDTTIEALREEYLDLVAYDESQFGIDLDDFADDPTGLADGGYFDRDSRRILFWASEEECENDLGGNAVASAEWAE